MDLSEAELAVLNRGGFVKKMNTWAEAERNKGLPIQNRGKKREMCVPRRPLSPRECLTWKAEDSVAAAKSLQHV